MEISSKKLETIVIEYEKSNEEQSADCMWMNKLEANLKRIDINSWRRMKKEEDLRALRRKHTYLERDTSDEE